MHARHLLAPSLCLAPPLAAALLTAALLTAALLTAACVDAPPGGKPQAPADPTGEGEGEDDPDTDPIEVPGGDIDIDASSITADPPSARADGVGFVDVTVALVSHDGAPIAGRAVTVVVAGDANVLFDAAAPTASNGKTTVRLRADLPGDAIVSAEMPDADAIARLSPLTVTFEPCLSVEDTFTHELWGPVFSRCVGCHNAYGLPQTEEFGNSNILTFPGESGFASNNVEMLKALSFDVEGMIYLVAKPTGQLEHLGGVVITPGSSEEALLQGFAERLMQTTDLCGPDAPIPAERVLSDIAPASRHETLARARMTLLGEPLTAAEAALALGTDDELAAALDALLEDPRASDRVVEIYNDWLWTDRFTREVTASTGGRNFAIARLNNQFGTRRFFFQENGTNNQSCDPATDVCCGESAAQYPGTCEQPLTANNAADSLAREPLELVRHIWRNDLSADLIATADFTMANPYLAVLYGFAPADDEWTFDNNNTPDNDRREFMPLVLRDKATSTIAAQPGVGDRYPHAGILTPHATMLRFPSTESNRERRRAARIIYERFLGIDVMKLADFSTAGLPPDADLESATRSEIACTACHAVMDPVARTLYSFGENGNYLPGRARPPREEMFEAGFMGERFCSAGDEFCSANITGGQADTRDHVGDPVRWLVERVVQTPRFSYAMVLPLFSGLTGARVVRAPPDVAVEDFAEKNLAFAIQNTYLTALGERFDANHGRNLKALARDILMGPFFRGAGYVGEPGGVEAHALALAGVGRGTLVTPEQLSRKLLALTEQKLGAPNNAGEADFLRNFNEYRLLFGGVNWESLTVRFREPNPVMMRVVERMAHQVSCRVVVEDAARTDAAGRKLFTEGFAPTETDDAAVRTQVRALRLKLLGEDLDESDEEIALLAALFQDARTMAEAADDALPTACRVTASATHTALTADPTGALRAWMAVTAALLSDPLFIVE